MPRVAVIIGTRPEGIKMAAVCHALQEAPDMELVLVSTGQHREMLAQVLDVFALEGTSNSI
jgi:UDP-N-acetylglucosamine 2-epimerase (non-hydrolysing)